MNSSIRSTACTLTVALVVTLAPSAQAFDLSGHWSGVYKCKGSFGGEKDSYEDDLEVNITQAGAAVGANISFSGTPYSYNGLAVANATKPDKGDLMLTICGTDDNLSAGQFDELGRFKVATKPTKGTGSISGASYYSSTGPPQAYTCKWKLKRIPNSGAPAVPTTCP
jgi:hypothetical protein